MANQKLNLTRDQLASFLKNYDQIKQFEKLFAIVDQVSASPDTAAIDTLAGDALAAANNAIALIEQLAGLVELLAGNAEQKAIQALDQLSRIADAVELLANAPAVDLSELQRIANTVEMLATAPIRNQIELSHDVVGTLPAENLPSSTKSNQVLTWLSM